MTDLPQPVIACTLTPEELASRQTESLPGLVRQAVETVELADGWRLRFENKPGLLQTITQTIEQERSCCPFLRFNLTCEPETGPIVVEVTGPTGTRELLRGLIAPSDGKSPT